MLGGKENNHYLCNRIYVERLSIVFFDLGGFQGLVLNVNPPNSREGSKRARKIDHKPSAVRSKVFFMVIYVLRGESTEKYTSPSFL